MKKLVLGAILVTALAMPSGASAHTLRVSVVRTLAADVCRDINRVDPTENPYACRRLLRAERRSRHAFLIGLRLVDPNDGERCTAVLRIRYRSARSRTVIAKAAGHNCYANPFAGL